MLDSHIVTIYKVRIMESEKNVDKVLKIIGEYRALPIDFTGIEELMYKRKLLAAYGVGLAVDVGKARTKWKRKTLKYDVVRNQKKITYYKQFKNLAKSDIYAKANSEDYQTEAVAAENIFYEGDYILKAIREVLGEMNQRISYLRGEMKQEQFYSKGD